MTRRFSFALFLLVTVVVLAGNGLAQIDMSKMEALKPRNIGPAAMSGRVTCFAVDPRNKAVIYTGTASGGLWRSTSGGLTWELIFGDQGSSSIGAVSIDPMNPDVIWVGTGEGNPRNSQNVGDGVYKSIDSGRTWQKLGLEKTEHIHRIRIHPHNSDVVYVGAAGPTWSEGEERGVFKTTDGGKTWNKILYVNNQTGIADLVMDPSNPNKLIAAMWQHRRWPWFFKSGGEGSGLYVTFDGGENWEERTSEDGLPEGELGRMGLGIATSQPNVVYALIESKKNALYRSQDGGFKWTRINDKPGIGNRPFYYFDIRVDPTNENRIYSLHSTVTYSEDGGKSFETLIPFAKAHPDHHAFWIDPDNPNFLLNGNDGGMYMSYDRGANWRFVENLPLGQFYHVAVDMAIPYNVYGGLQDNGSFVGPSEVWEGGFGGGILNSHWRMVSFGDGFDTVPDPADSRYGYAMSQGGNLYRFDLETFTTRFIRPNPPDKDTYLRFNWNAGIAIDPFEPRTVYYGSQFLHRSSDQGNTWEIISPDLTSNDPEKQQQLDSGGLTYDVTNAENHTTIIAIAPSPVERGVLWVGTDDGNVQITLDGGGAWDNVIANIPGVPAGTWVPHIEAGKKTRGEAFVVFEDHRRGNWTPYAFHTTDYGKTWRNMAEKGVRGFVYVIEQDPVEDNLLFLGTEFDLYVSIDKGKNWSKWESGYPTVPTRDLVIHPRDGDLVIGTFGRAFWILDDIRPFRALARQGAALLEQPLSLFEVAPVYQAAVGSSPGELIAGDAVFRGENRPRGALVTYYLNPDEPESAEESEEAKKEKVKIEILHGDSVIRTIDGTAEDGMNRVVWSLDRKSVRRPSRNAPREDAPEPGGRPVQPGEYSIRVSYGQHHQSQPVKVLSDPRTSFSKADMDQRDRFRDELMELIRRTTESTDRLREAKEQMDKVADLIKGRDGEKITEIKEQSKETRKALDSLLERFFPEAVQGIRRDPKLVMSRLFSVSGYVESGWAAPTATERTVFDQVKTTVEATLGDIDGFFDAQWKAYTERVRSARVPLIEE